MTTLAQKQYITSKHLLILFIGFELLFFLVMLKSIELSYLYVILFALLFHIYHHPEFGLALALTGRVLISMFYDNISLSFPYQSLTTYLVIVILGIVMFYFKHRAKPVSFSAPQLWAALVLLILIIGLTYSTNPSYGKQKVIFYTTFNFLLVIAPILILDSEKKVSYIFTTAYLLGLALAIITLPLALSTSTIFRFYPSDNVNPIWFSRSLGVSLLASVFIISTIKRRAVKIFILATWPLFIYLMLRSWSRGPMLGIILALIIFFYLQPKISWRLKIIGGAVIFFAGVGILLVTSNVILARLQAPISQEASAAFRVLAWIEAVRMFIAHPLTGIGTGSFFIDFPFTPFIWPHNIFLEAASENGIIGFLALGMFFLTTFLLGLKNIRLATLRKNRQMNIIAVTIFIFALWNSQMSGDITGNEIIWLAAGLISALALIQDGRLKAHEKKISPDRS